MRKSHLELSVLVAVSQSQAVMSYIFNLELIKIMGVSLALALG